MVARLGLMSVPGFRHCHPGRASSFFRPFLRSAGGAGLHSLRCMELIWFSFPSSGEPGYRSVDLFPPGWNGSFYLWKYSGRLLGQLRRPEVSPRCKHLGAGLPGPLGSCFWSFLPPSGSGYGCFCCPSCSFHPAPAWFPRRLRLRGC